MTDFFKQSLASFTKDTAYGGAIRHLADNGLTVKEITANLSYPVAENVVSEYVWKHFVDNKTICINLADAQDEPKGEFVKVTGKYGKTSFVKKDSGINNQIPKEYVECNFGTDKKYNPKEYERELSLLNDNDREYIEGLPWPARPVYHIKNERMARIADLLHMKIFMIGNKNE